MLKKQAIRDNGVWLQAFEHCTETWSYAETEHMADAVIERIIDVSKGYSRIAYGWCAGKDSIVLADIIERADIDCKPMMWRGINEWPDMRRWIDANAPEGIQFNTVDKFTFDYLNRHPRVLFCQDGTRTEWMKEKWTRMKRDLKGYDLFITGRRIQDGNLCGTDGITHGTGYDTFNPLYRWPHELMLAYIKHHNIKLPPFYLYPRGFLCGSVAMGEWTEYPAMGMSEKQVFDEIWRIDPDIVRGATGLDAAMRYLETIG